MGSARNGAPIPTPPSAPSSALPRPTDAPHWAICVRRWRSRYPLAASANQGEQLRVSSPDRGRIEEIDLKPRPILFTDDMLFLKDRMIGDEENPYTKVYFVDV